MKTIILGVGNPILGNDGVGLKVLEELKKDIKKPNIKFDEAYAGGMNLLDLMIDYDRAILIDAVKMKNRSLGEISFSDLQQQKTVHTCNPHDVSLPEAIQLSKKLGEQRIPDIIKLMGINIGELPVEFTEKLTKEISDAVPKAVDIIKKEVEGDEGL